MLFAAFDTPAFDFTDFPPLDDLEEYKGASSSKWSLLSPVFLAALEEMYDLAALEEMDKDEGRARILDDLEGIDKEVERQRSSLAETEVKWKATFPALARGRSKMRNFLELVAVAVTAVMVVAKRRDAMRKFMVTK